MPIVVPVPDPNTPLSQGDILKGVLLFYTGAPGTAVAHKSPYCLVISRPCVTAHKNRVVVAAVERYKNDDVLKQLESYDEAKEFYADIRDGKSSPDQFYLGQLEGEKGSFCARLDSLHTIELPPENKPDRQQFVTSVRVACLDAAFTHDLHQRLFRAFASLGFDDHSWYSTADLRVLVGLGEVALADANKQHLEAKSQVDVKESQDAFKNMKERANLEAEVANKQQAVEALNAELVPLRAELARREASQVGTQPCGNPASDEPK